MKKILIFTVSFFFTLCINAQYSLTFKDINPTGDGSPFSLNPQGFLNGKMYFNANDGVNGFSLWETDGTLAGTKLTAPVYADKFLNYNNKLYFRGGANSELYVTDGTAAGTKVVSPFSARNPFTSIVFDGKIFYGGQYGTNGAELWVSDGTDTGTHLFKDINTAGNDPGVYYSMIVYNGKLYFEGDNGSSGRELFVCDGTPAGTSLLKDIYPGSTGSFPRDLTIFNGKLYFTADNGTNGAELWVTDGTTAGTQMLKDIYVGTSGARAYTYGITLYNNKLYFAAQDAATGIELWQTDGTASGTTMVADFFAGTIGSNPRFITVYKNKLYFSAYTSSAGVELCVSDGTNAGTQLFKDINTYIDGATPYGSSPWSLTLWNDKLAFIGDVSTTAIHDNQLFVTDGTVSGTKMVQPAVAPNINPLGSSSYFGNLIPFNNSLFFAANYDGIGGELWKLNDVDFTGIKDETESVYSLYPNPIQNGFFTIKIDERVGYSLFDISGKLLQAGELNAGENQIQLASVSPGVYYVRIGQGVKKLIVQ